jgi:hypothetical protein
MSEKKSCANCTQICFMRKDCTKYALEFYEDIGIKCDSWANSQPVR